MGRLRGPGAGGHRVAPRGLSARLVTGTGREQDAGDTRPGSPGPLPPSRPRAGRASAEGSPVGPGRDWEGRGCRSPRAAGSFAGRFWKRRWARQRLVRTKRRSPESRPTRDPRPPSEPKTSPGGLEPPTFRLTAERADRLRHGDPWALLGASPPRPAQPAWGSCLGCGVPGSP